MLHLFVCKVNLMNMCSIVEEVEVKIFSEIKTKEKFHANHNLYANNGSH